MTTNVSGSVYNKVIRIVAMQRSGHHAIIMWMAQHMDANVSFMNITNGSWKRGERIIKVLKTIEAPAENVFIFNQEEYHPKDHALRNPLGQPITRTIWIHRDPYNLLASRKRKGHRMYGLPAMKLYNLQGEMSTDKNIFPLSYDRWVVDENYRAALGRTLGLSASCSESYTQETQYGDGSSFEDFDKTNLTKLLHRKDFLSEADKLIIKNNINPVDQKIFEISGNVGR